MTGIMQKNKNCLIALIFTHLWSVVISRWEHCFILWLIYLPNIYWEISIIQAFAVLWKLIGDEIQNLSGMADTYLS